MIFTQTQKQSLPLVLTTAESDRLELSRLFAAAVVNHQFCHLLLNDPEKALQNGYQGESFLLNDEERTLILSIRAETVTDLARQLMRTLDGQSYTLTTNSTYL